MGGINFSTCCLSPIAFIILTIFNACFKNKAFLHTFSKKVYLFLLNKFEIYLRLL